MSQKYLGVLKGTGSLSLKLRGGEAAMISMREVEEHPQMLSTNRNIMQGIRSDTNTVSRFVLKFKKG